MPKGGLMAAQMVSNEEIDAILQYVEEWQPPTADVVGDGGGSGTAQAPGAGSGDQGISTVWLIIVAFILLVLIFSLAGVRSSLTRLNSAILDSEGKEVEPELSSGERFKVWMLKNKAFVAIIGILITVYLSVLGYDAL